MTKQCELCDLPARMFCESDQASLCWECDAKVHGANFLVAKHSRTLLCRSCQAPTPWRASGSRLGSTITVCHRCMGNSAGVSDCAVEQEEMTTAGGGGRGSGWTERGVGEGGDEEGEDVSEEDDDEEEEEDEDEDEDEDADNQVVPWSMEADATASRPPVASCSSSDESSGMTSFCYGFLKRKREEDDLPFSQDDSGCSPSQPGYFRSPPAAGYSGRTPEDDGSEGEDAPQLDRCFPLLRDRRMTVRPAGWSTSSRPAIWKGLWDR